MGCCKSKGAAAPKAAAKAAANPAAASDEPAKSEDPMMDPSPAPQEEPAATAPAEAVTVAAPAAAAAKQPLARTPATRAEISCTQVATLLKRMRCTQEQMMFFETWSELIGNKALALPGVKATVSMLTDLNQLELQITALAAPMLALARDFVGQVGVPPVQLTEMELASKELGPNQVTLWCKLKHIQSSAPAIDAGYALIAPMNWMVLDMLMPPAEDQDSLRDYAVQEHVMPSDFGCSFFPSEPERRLIFEMGNDESTRKSMLSAFFFFKSLGFAKPEDTVVKLLSSSQPASFNIRVTMGPKGLTGLEVTLMQPAKNIGRSLAEAVSFKYDEAGLGQVMETMGAAADMVGYGAEAVGYVVTVGFSSG